MKSNEPGTALEPPLVRRTAERFANLGDRLARSLPAAVRAEPPANDIGEPDYPFDDDQETAWYEVVPRFPMARSGYECSAVDEHVAGLEQELAELDRELATLRAQTPVKDEVAAEIERIGHETSAILVAAHDSARETTRQAQEQADRCLADAAASALAMTQEATRKREEIEKDIERLNGERSRLLSDLEALAGQLGTVARQGRERKFGNHGPAATPAPVPAPEAS